MANYVTSKIKETLFFFFFVLALVCLLAPMLEPPTKFMVPILLCMILSVFAAAKLGNS